MHALRHLSRVARVNVYLSVGVPEDDYQKRLLTETVCPVPKSVQGWSDVRAETLPPIRPR